MGKRVRGAALRAKKRAKEAVEELQERQAEQVASQSVVAIPNEALFVLDATGDASAVPHSQRPSKKKKKQKGLSEKDQRAVDKLLKTHGASKLQALAEQGRARMPDQFTRPKSLSGRTRANFDLWKDDNESETAVVQKKNKKKETQVGACLAGTAPAHVAVKAQRATSKPLAPSRAVDVAKGGQSYRPDPVAHQKIMETAVQVELRRNEAEEYQQKPISQGLSAETRALLVGDSSDDDDEDSSIDKGDAPVGPLVKRTDKLTRAQRNKQRRLRQEQAMMRKLKTHKRLLNQVAEIPRFAKELQREQRAQHEKRQQKKTVPLLGQNVETKLSHVDPISAPTVPVALPSKVASLRTLLPKGSLVQDRLDSLRDRNLSPKRAMDRQTKGKRKVRVKNRRDHEGSDYVVLG